MSVGTVAYSAQLTPVEYISGVWLKRDDLFTYAGMCGGKCRTCAALAANCKTGLVTAGSRSSPQVNIVAHIARHLGLPCRVHIPSGQLTPELQAAYRAGAEPVQHTPGYNSVIVSRARTDALARGWCLVPFGMECRTAVAETARQVENLPFAHTKRIVVPVGSGMSLAGILHGLEQRGERIPVMGVVVGANPIRRLDVYAPAWRDRCTLISAGMRYDKPAAGQFRLGSVLLDPIYEAKVLPFLQQGDTFWIVGIRQTAS